MAYTPQDFFDGFHTEFYHFYEAIINSTDNYVYVVDMSTDMAIVSPNMQRDFDLPDRLVPHLVPTWGELIHERDKVQYYESIEKMLQGDTDEHNVEYQVRNRKGEYVWVLCRGLLQRDGKGCPRMFAGVVTDLKNKGKFDYTTGLLTHMECEKHIGSIIKEEEESPGGILLLGLDNFARINSLKNHIFGDGVLRKFAQETQRLLPEEARMYRFDGDEFAVIYKGAPAEKIKELYHVIHAYSNRPHQLDDREYFCTVSGGIAMLAQDSRNYPELIKCASVALEESKRRGKNMVTVYSPDLMQGRLRSLELASQLQYSVMNGMEGFELQYQPVANYDGQKLSGAEALLRWSSPSLGRISPMEFIPILELTNLIVPVGKWVLEQAVSICKRWTAYQADFVMNVNVSYLQMLDENFIQDVRQILERYGLGPGHIVLELTESCFVTDMDGLKDTFQKLRSLDIRLAMDDFGTGYSSLGMLSRSPADIVKIDRVFISDIGDIKNAFNRSFIGSVIQLCHSVGITVCVEGVERQEELKTVCDLKTDNIQGYYLSRPIYPEEFEKKYWP